MDEYAVAVVRKATVREEHGGPVADGAWVYRGAQLPKERDRIDVSHPGGDTLVAYVTKVDAGSDPPIHATELP